MKQFITILIKLYSILSIFVLVNMPHCGWGCDLWKGFVNRAGFEKLEKETPIIKEHVDSLNWSASIGE